MAEVKNNYAMAIVRAQRKEDLARAAELVDQAIKLLPHPPSMTRSDGLSWNAAGPKAP
jgi:hypothetical protein